MAHAQYHKNQRVYVRPVGTWALVERVVPQWTKGLDSPIRIYYDVGLGREFGADELQPEAANESVDETGELWRVVRTRNKWQADAETMNHPYPGTYPVIATGEIEGGGWRVPGAEYAVSPARIERQARMIATAPRLAAITKALAEWAKANPQDVPEALHEMVVHAEDATASIENGTE